MNKTEYFPLYDENGKQTGVVKERKEVHHDGDLHGASHIWIMRKRMEAGREITEVFLQKRSHEKDSFPDCYDCSAAGHVSEGEDFLTAAIRELSEELGIEAKEEDLEFLFMQKVGGENVFHGRSFKNYEINHIYLYNKAVEIEDIHFQEDEIQAVEWRDACLVLKELKAGDNGNDEAPESGYCMWISEFEKVWERFQKRA